MPGCVVISFWLTTPTLPPPLDGFWVNAQTFLFEKWLSQNGRSVLEEVEWNGVDTEAMRGAAANQAEVGEGPNLAGITRESNGRRRLSDAGGGAGRPTLLEATGVRSGARRKTVRPSGIHGFLCIYIRRN